MTLHLSHEGARTPLGYLLLSVGEKGTLQVERGLTDQKAANVLSPALCRGEEEE